jgi:hypothetical protein
MWLAEYHRQVCSTCNGLGFFDQPPCTNCGGERFVELDEFRIGVIAGATVDLDQVVRFLPVELLAFGGNDEQAACQIASRAISYSPFNRILFLDGGCWRVMVMGLDLANLARPGPHPVYVPGAGNMWHNRRDAVSRFVLADWYEEHDQPDYAHHLREHEVPW